MDFKALVEILKEQGLEVAEDAAEVLAESVLKWLEGEVVKSENKYDDLLLAVLPVIRPMIFKAIDKIDGVSEEA